MKRISILTAITACLFLLPGKGIAQGNLQFNEVKYFQFALTQNSGVYQDNSQVVTVPANKVWKIEAATATYHGLTNGYAIYGGRILVDNHVIFDYANTPGMNTTVPFWLPAGTYTFSLRSNTTSGTFYFNGAISVIEFNVVP